MYSRKWQYLVKYNLKKSVFDSIIFLDAIRNFKKQFIRRVYFMRKQTKIAAIISAAALLAFGASMTASAATGWQEENGTWVYYKAEGEKATSTWQKSGDHTFWLDENGEMATDKLVEDKENFYYVNDKGHMVTNQWVEVDNTADDSEEAPATVWYYFQADGKAYKGSGTGVSFKKIAEKQYAFDTEGKMLFGWVNADGERQTGDDAWKSGVYYLGASDDGARVTSSWLQLPVVDDNENKEYWFYFQHAGKKYAGEKKKTINGRKYSFDADGNMLSGWYEVEGSAGAGSPPDRTDRSPLTSTADVDGFVYHGSSDDGALYTNRWFKVAPSKWFDEEDSSDKENNERWFYADNQGNPVNSKIKTIGGKKYAFDAQGEMVSGLVQLAFAGTGDISAVTKLDTFSKVTDITGFQASGQVNLGVAGVTGVTQPADGVYYFGEESDGALRSGNTSLTVDGESLTYKFSTAGNKGQGLHGKDGKAAYYINGLKVKASSDDKFKAYKLDASNNIEYALDSRALVKNAPLVPRNSKWVGSDQEIETGGTVPGLAGAVNVTAGPPVTVTDNPAKNIVVISSSGALQQNGAKKDGNDVYLVVKGGFLAGAYTVK